MAILEMESFGNAVIPTGWVDGLFDDTYNITTTASGTRHAKGRAFHLTEASSRHPTRKLATPLAEGGFGVAVNATTPSNAAASILSLRENSGSGYASATKHISVVRNTATGQLEIRRGEGNGTLLATSTDSVPTGSWNHYGVEYKIDDTTGYVRVYVNGADTPTVEFTGDTRNGGTLGTVTHIGFAYYHSTQRVMDWFLFDTATSDPLNAVDGVLGDVRVEDLGPIGNGAANQWVGSDGNSTDNYLLVDDDATTTDYVGSATSGQQDLYALEDVLAAPAGGSIEVFAVQLDVLHAKSDAGTALPLLGVLRDADGTVATETLAAPASISTAYTWTRGSVRTLDPDGVAWTEATVNALQAGVEVGV